jgi:hypothetical protein
MNLNEYYPAHRDQFGRKYPLHIHLKNGEQIYGHVMVNNNFTEYIIKVIENLDDWNNNIIDMGTKKMNITASDIEKVEAYTAY